MIVRGLDRHVTLEDGPGAAAIIRPEAEDLFLARAAQHGRPA